MRNNREHRFLYESIYEPRLMRLYVVECEASEKDIEDALQGSRCPLAAG